MNTIPQNAAGQTRPASNLGPYGITEEEVKRKLLEESQFSYDVGIIDLPCYRLTVEPSDGYPWNGWVRRWREAPVGENPDDVDRWLPSGEGVSERAFISSRDPASFEAGSYWYALEHLYLCSTCRIYNRLYSSAIYKKILEIQKEWKKVMR